MQAKRGEEKQQDAPQEDSTMKVADAVVSTVTGGQHLPSEGKQKGGPIVHHSFGALMGGIYGGLAEYLPVARSGFGTSFGSASFAGADLLALPAFKLARALNLPRPSIQKPKFQDFRGSGLVLVIDDEEIVLKTTCTISRALRLPGHHSIERRAWRGCGSEP